MAFDRQFLTPIGATADGRTRWLYRPLTDLLGTILTTPTYFNGANDIIKQGDAVFMECLDGTAETFIETSSTAGVITFDPTPFSQGNVGPGGTINLSVAQNAGDVTITPSGGGTPAVIIGGTAAMSGILSASQALQLANLGTAASRNVGTAAGNLAELDGTGNLPASVLGNAPGGAGGSVTSVVGQTGAVTIAQILAAITAGAITADKLDAAVGRYGANPVRAGAQTLVQTDEDLKLVWTGGGSTYTVPFLAAGSQFQIKNVSATASTLSATGTGVVFDVQNTQSTTVSLPGGATAVFDMRAGSTIIDLTKDL